MMKVLKPIYYSALAVIMILFLIFTAVDFCGVSAKGYIDTDRAYKHVEDILKESPTRDLYLDAQYRQKAVDYITDYLSELGLTEINAFSDEDIIKTTGTVDKASFAVMETKVSAEDINDWYAEQGKQDRFVATPDVNLTNVVVYIPTQAEIGKDVSELKSDAVLYIAHYDSKSYSPGANNLAIIGAMLEAIKEIKSINGTNSFVFVFADGGERDALGAYAFREKFQGFNNVYSRVKAAFGFDSLGSKGALTLIESNDVSSKLAAKWAGFNKKAFSASAAQSLDLFKDRIFDYEIFTDIPALNFANVDNPTTENMNSDNLGNLNRKLLSQTGAAIVKSAESLANYKLDKLQNGTKAVNFSFLSGTISYGSVTSYILASLLLAFAIVVFVFNRIKKSFSIFDALKGSLVQILAIIISFLLTSVVYYLVGSLLAAMGFINIHALSTYLRSNIGLIIALSFISVALSMAAFILLKKLFRIRAADAVRGNIIIWTLLGIILGYAEPRLAYVFMFTAFLELAVALSMILLRDKFREKYQKDFERLLLFIVPLILTIPITFGASLMLYTVLGLSMYPLIMMFTVSAHGFITPYFNYLQPVLDKVAKKLPERSVKIERVVTEQVEHKAKKGKFEERVSKKVFIEKRPITYKNSFGITVITLIGVILFLAFSMSGLKYGYNYSGAQNRDYLAKNSLVYVKDDSSSYWMIDDLDMYNYLYFDLNGYKWDSKISAYKKPVSSTDGDLNKGNELAKLDNITTSIDGFNKTFTVNFPNIQNNTKFYYNLELNNAKTIEKIEITTLDNTGATVTQVITVNTSKDDLVIPNLRGQSVITITGKSMFYTGVLTIEAQVSSYDNPNLITGDFYGFSEWETIKAAAENKNIDVNVVLKVKTTKAI
ncbi:MAG TPA: M28 family peptidase [Clostridia bacterium]